MLVSMSFLFYDEPLWTLPAVEVGGGVGRRGGWVEAGWSQTNQPHFIIPICGKNQLAPIWHNQYGCTVPPPQQNKMRTVLYCHIAQQRN
jgi:hypothetical protein